MSKNLEIDEKMTSLKHKQSLKLEHFEYFRMAHNNDIAPGARGASQLAKPTQRSQPDFLR